MTSSLGAHMVDGNEIEPIKVRTGLFALITARIEDAHDIAVKGQAVHLKDQNVEDLIVDLRSMLDEIKIQIDAIELTSNR